MLWIDFVVLVGQGKFVCGEGFLCLQMWQVNIWMQLQHLEVSSLPINISTTEMIASYPGFISTSFFLSTLCAFSTERYFNPACTFALKCALSTARSLCTILMSDVFLACWIDIVSFKFRPSLNDLTSSKWSEWNRT